MVEWQIFTRPLIAALLGGIVCGIIGVWVVLLNIPFVGVAMSHAAFAGAILGLLLGIDPLGTGILFCLLTALLIGPIAEKADFEPGVALGVIFSLMLGLAFLGIGLLKGPRTEAFKFIWGNILLVSRRDIIILGVLCLAVLGFLFAFAKEIRAVLFNREIARAVGIPERAIFFALILLTGIAVTVNLNTVGGLLVFSLVVSPSSAAYQLTYRLRTMYLLSVIFAVGACLIGLFLSYLFNLPTGASIICIASIIFGAALLFSPKRRRKLPLSSAN
ncbi:MAG: metal ABC transporter permease [candidate division WOR-3 bacterium]|jgi:manganese/iron transport system permease protein|nr:metal ABC transporter permease [candidate division WOR-3 bacterium]MCR4424562.1 metal ABC transporter permease [candidate division WOR-3 bacterium]MDH7519328.1 metal ABC transporter permease [bacterium]